MAPQDVHCEGFDMTYTRIANDSSQSSTAIAPGSGGIPSVSSSVMSENNNYFLDKKVDDSIENFLKSLIQIGPELLSGCLTLSFFERRASKQLFGLVSHEEKVIWEQWIMHIVVNNTPRPVNDDKASIMERQRIQDTAEVMLRSVFTKIYEYASGAEEIVTIAMGQKGQMSTAGNKNRLGSLSGGGLDHIPPSMYEFEIRCSKRADDRENVYSRVANMPSLLNLDGG